MSKNACKVSLRGSELEYTAEDGANLLVSILSTGQTFISVVEGPKETTAMLSNRAAHELRDFLNRRFPNSTEVQ